MTKNSTTRLVTIFGGSGFIGRHIVRALANDGWRIRVAVRHPNTGHFLKPMGRVGQIQLVKANILKEADVAEAVTGAQTVINLVGAFKRFNQMHVDAPKRIAEQAKAAGASRLVHFSAIGADKNEPARYFRSKAEGEASVREAFPSAVIIRPGVVFGPEDCFFNRFAAMMRLTPLFFPLFGGGVTRFQPVYVGDIALAVSALLENAESKDKIYEFAGPEIMSFRQVIEKVSSETQRSRSLVPVPLVLAKLMGAMLQFLPNAPLTFDQARMLETDTVMSGTFPGLRELGINPTAAAAIVASYLWRFRKLGQFEAVAH